MNALSSQTINNTDAAIHSPKLLSIYCIYRLIIAVLLFGFSYFGVPSVLGTNQSSYLPSITLGYLVFSVAFYGIIHTRLSNNITLFFLSLCTDIATLTLLTFSSGGIETGLGNLIIVVIAAGSIIVPNRLAFLLAAFASLAVLYTQYYISPDKFDYNEYLKAGILGIVFFTTAFIIQYVSRRIQASESLARRREADLVDLEQLNHLIIQRMRTGIVVCTANGHIRMMNESAVNLLKLGKNDKSANLPPDLQQRLQRWLDNPKLRTPPFRSSTYGPDIQANFTQLKRETSSDILIFLEDNAQITQQAQQLKLASLGRLTAGIAHEIRNPLGAVSHAAQLLRESPNLDQGDYRLTEIIQDHTKRMNIVIENVLQLSRRKPAQAEVLNLSDWLNKYTQQFSMPGIDNPEIKLSTAKKPITVRFDPSQMTQVLNNLCQNGLRYSREHSGTTRIFLNLNFNESEQP